MSKLKNMYDKIYYPYPSTDSTHKYLIITSTGKKLRFGRKGYEHYTEGHLDEERKQRYLDRHKKRENWNDFNSAGAWSAKFLWKYPSYKEAYQKIKKELLKGGYITEKQYKEYVF